MRPNSKPDGSVSKHGHEGSSKSSFPLVYGADLHSALIVAMV
jgi:hypothetical protein